MPMPVPSLEKGGEFHGRSLLLTYSKNNEGFPCNRTNNRIMTLARERKMNWKTLNTLLLGTWSIRSRNTSGHEILIELERCKIDISCCYIVCVIYCGISKHVRIKEGVAIMIYN